MAHNPIDNDSYQNMIKKAQAEATAHDATSIPLGMAGIHNNLYYFNDNLPDCINAIVIIVDLYGQVTSFNRMAENITGYSRDEIIGTKSLSMLLGQDIMPDILAGISNSPKGALTQFSHISTITSRDGECRAINWNCSTIIDNNGNISGFILFGHDVSGESLKKQVSGASDHIVFYNDLLSHDIRNYSQIALGYLELMRDASCLDDNVRYMIDQAYYAIKRSNDLVVSVKKLIDVDKMGATGNAREHIGNVLRRNIELITSAHLGKKVSVEVRNVDDPVVYVNDFIDDVFYNLLDNAVKYDTHTDVNITVEVVGPVYDGQACWDIRVSDHGPGIPDSLKELIFMRRSKSTHGWGLGLSLSNAIIEKLNGKIWVEDRVPGDHRKGSTFVIRMPGQTKDDKC